MAAARLTVEGKQGRAHQALSVDDLGELVIPELEAAPDLGKRPWTEHERDVLRSYYGRKKTAAIAEYLGRTVPAVHKQAEGLGLTRR